MAREEAMSTAIRLLTLNVHGGLGPRLRSLTAFLATSDADVMCLQECHPALLPWLRRTLPPQPGKPWSSVDAPASFLGNAVLTRLPIHRHRALVLAAPGTPEVRSAVDVTLQHPEGPLRVVCTHLDHRSTDARLAQWRGLDDQTERVAGGLLVGDLNALKRSDYDAPTLARVAAERSVVGWEPPGFALLDALAEVGFVDAAGCAPIAWTSRFDTRIDYVLAAPDCAWRPGQLVTLPAIAGGVSDHNAVLVTLQPG